GLAFLRSAGPRVRRPTGILPPTRVWPPASKAFLLFLFASGGCLSPNPGFRQLMVWRTSNLRCAQMAPGTCKPAKKTIDDTAAILGRALLPLNENLLRGSIAVPDSRSVLCHKPMPCPHWKASHAPIVNWLKSLTVFDRISVRSVLARLAKPSRSEEHTSELQSL